MKMSNGVIVGLLRIYLTYDNNDSNSRSSNDNWLGSGSGIILTTDGYIATNYHVIEDISTVEVEFIHEGKIKQYNADIVKIDPVNDLAILKINDNSFNNLKSIEYNFKTKTSDIGESVFALGYTIINLRLRSFLGTNI